MKVKVGDRIYDSSKEPVMVILTPEDKAKIAAMDSEATKYVSFPDSMKEKAVKKWMNSKQKRPRRPRAGEGAVA
jgi:hypothetical protein